MNSANGPLKRPGQRGETLGMSRRTWEPWNPSTDKELSD